MDTQGGRKLSLKAVGLIDSFIPKSILATPQELPAYRIYIGTNWLLAVLELLIILLITYVGNLPPKNLLIAYAVICPMIAVFVATPFIVKYRGWFRPCLHITMGALQLNFTVSVFINGGPLHSTTAFLLIIPAMFGFCLGGLKTGLIWLGVCFAITLSGSFATLMGFQFLQVTSPENHDFIQLVVLLAGFIGLSIIILIYQTTNSSLRDELQRQASNHEYQSLHDSLTGLPNRLYYRRAVENRFAQARQSTSRFALLYIDLDKFKAINDNYGHDIGDKVLIEAARRIKKAARKADPVFRIGGDEFVVLVNDITGEQEPYAVIDRMKDILRAPYDSAAPLSEIDLSIGMAIYPDDESDIQSLERHADRKMYRYKQAKRDKNIAS